MRLLLCTAPMVQINTPYPATAYLTAYLRKQGFAVDQADPALELALRLFSKEGIQELEKAARKKKKRDDVLEFFLSASADYAARVDDAVAFLQGKHPQLAAKIAKRKYFPEGPRFLSLQQEEAIGSANLKWSFAGLSTDEKARHVASLFLDDIADYIRLALDPSFAFSRYGEQLAASQTSFTPLFSRLHAPASTYIERFLKDIVQKELLATYKPDILGISVPFAGAMLGALQLAKLAKEKNPNLVVVCGGGYVNTELRDLSDTRVFDYIDYFTYDDGERPMEQILRRLQGERTELLRTRHMEDGKVVFSTSAKLFDVPFAEWPAPTYKGLPREKYIPMLETLNPLQRLWSDSHWNKLTLAHGCYWKKCSFCDTSLDYINRYEHASAETILDRMETLIAETGETGFHFVDEAAPPKMLQKLSEGILRRGLKVRWWGNIRFEKTFTKELTQLMAEAGCIAVTGGLEVASDRILRLIQKGVDIPQVSQVTRNFTDAGVFVHAYLMYGFPTESTQETIDSLEVVRQLFAESCIHSGFWHRFALTVHSPIFKNPASFGIELLENPIPKEGIFARNDLPFRDPTPTPHDSLGDGLKRALFNYMHGIGLDEELSFWFTDKVPKTKIKRTLVRDALSYG